MSGVSAAQPYHCGASLRNARQTAIGRPPIRANITVSSVESSVGIVQRPKIAAGLSGIASGGEGWMAMVSAHDD